MLPTSLDLDWAEKARREEEVWEWWRDDGGMYVGMYVGRWVCVCVCMFKYSEWVREGVSEGVSRWIVWVVCEWVSECEWVWVSVSECEWVSVRVRVSVWVSECECECVCEWVSVSECEWLCVCEWVWVSVCVWVCVEGGGREGEGGGADTELKTKTPHVNVGKNPTRQCGEQTVGVPDIFNTILCLTHIQNNLRPAPRNPRPWLLRRLRYAFWRLCCVSLLLTEAGFGSVSNFQLCCDVLRFFWFLYCCCKYVTSMIIGASGFYTVVCDHSSKTPSWSCLLHLFYNKDKKWFASTSGTDTDIASTVSSITGAL